MENIYPTIQSAPSKIAPSINHLEYEPIKKWLAECFPNTHKHAFISSRDDLVEYVEDADIYFIDFDFCQEKCQLLNILFQIESAPKVVILSSDGKNGSNYLLASLYQVHAFFLKDQLDQNSFKKAIGELCFAEGKFSAIKTIPPIDMQLQNAFTLYDFKLREREIFAEVIRGKTNTEISNKLGISARTVESHRSNVIQRLGSRNFLGVILKIIAHMQQNLID